MWQAMMKIGGLFAGMIGCLLAGPAIAQQAEKVGLKGEYYNGTNFEQKVLTRIDPQLNFTWRGRSPASGIDQSYYSVRWTGKLVAPASGRYTFNAMVDDGIRIWVGNRKVMDVWQLNDSKTFTGSIVLEGGHVYDLRVDYFNDMLEGEIKLYWVRPDAKKPILGMFGDDGELISARYFRQPTPPVAPLPKPVVTPPVVASATPAKPIRKPPVVASARPIKPAAKPPVTASVTPARTIDKPEGMRPEPAQKPAVDVVPPISEPVTASSVNKPVALPQVQFEQSSYILLPQSFPELDKLVHTLQANPEWRIELIGHTDNVGDPRINQTLSEYRARVVMNYLTRHGIAENRLSAKGYGGSRPVADNATEADRAKNRRVEFVLK